MVRYEVLRTFAAKETIQRGQVIENPTYRNLGTLVRTGYLREITEEATPEVSETASKTSKPKKGVKNGNK